MILDLLLNLTLLCSKYSLGLLRRLCGYINTDNNKPLIAHIWPYLPHNLEYAVIKINFIIRWCLYNIVDTTCLSLINIIIFFYIPFFDIHIVAIQVLLQLSIPKFCSFKSIMYSQAEVCKVPHNLSSYLPSLFISHRLHR